MSLDLETRIAKLEAVNDIKSLKIRYAMACDQNYSPDLLAPMFTADAVWDGGEKFGRHESREAIYDYFKGISGTINWAMHYIVGGDVTVDDDLTSASATWQLWCPVAMLVDGKSESVVLAAEYADKYEKQDGEWLFKEMVVNFTLQAKTDVGWGDTQFHLNS